MNIKKMIKLKSVLLLCLVWVCAFAVPVQSQVATALTCDTATALTDGTDYELTADCDGASTAITVAAGVTATVDGGGFTISGATGTVISVDGAGASLTVSDLTIDGTTGAPAIAITAGGSLTLNSVTISNVATDPVINADGAATTLTLNNITITGSGTAGERVLQVQGGATLIARNAVFRGNAGNSIRVINRDSSAELTNVQFLNNGPATDAGREGSVLTAWGQSGGPTTVTINGATFSGNSGRPQVIRANSGAVVTLTGCIRASGNTNADGDPALFKAFDDGGAAVNGGPGGCPSKKKKEKTPVPTATERPPTAATCVGLREATGIAVNATFGLASGVQCQQLDGGGIGIQALAENYIAAVDIWGYVDQGVEVCFPQATGRIFFLDARMIPRSVVPMQSYVADNMLCASTETPGSIVLLPPE